MLKRLRLNASIVNLIRRCREITFFTVSTSRDLFAGSRDLRLELDPANKSRGVDIGKEGKFSISRQRLILITVFMFIMLSTAWALPQFGEQLCHEAGFSCHKVKKGESWTILFPDAAQRDLVKRVNRMNIFLQPGMVIAVPQHLKQTTLMDVAPFPHQIESRHERMIWVERQLLAWAAYDEEGRLVKWGPVSIGVTRCPDVDGGCLTPVGEYRVLRKQGKDCVSSVFPKRLEGLNGGAAMPYCMHFYKGYAFHGSDELPGRASSHGCINLFQDDAKWLNQQFASSSLKGRPGTLVVIQ